MVSECGEPSSLSGRARDGHHSTQRTPTAKQERSSSRPDTAVLSQLQELGSRVGRGSHHPNHVIHAQNTIHAERKPAFQLGVWSTGGARQRCSRDLLPLQIPRPGSLTGFPAGQGLTRVVTASPVTAQRDGKLVPGLLGTLPPVPSLFADFALFSL